jgi:hypothetical protein
VRRTALESLLGFQPGEGLPPPEQLSKRIEAAVAARKGEFESQSNAARELQAKVSALG